MSLKGKLLSILRNIRLGWKGLPWTNTPAYTEYSENMASKSIIILDPGNLYIG
jgi:hypothetical protein